MMQRNSWLRWPKVAVVCTVGLALLGVLLYLGSENWWRLYRCARCAAGARETKRIVFWTPVRHKLIFYESSLSVLRAKLIGPCAHSWRFVTGDHYKLTGYYRTACGNSAAYPFSNILDRDCLTKGMALLPSDDLRIRAFRAIGDPENRTSYLAAAFVMALTSMPPDDLSKMDWTQWWSERELAFAPCSDYDGATERVKKFMSAHPDELDDYNWRTWVSTILK